MRPYRFEVRGGKTFFFYKYNELNAWLRMGKEHGSTGMILVRREGNMLIYRGFGTLDHPRKYIMTFLMNHCPSFSGDMPTDQSRVNPPEPIFPGAGILIPLTVFPKSRGSLSGVYERYLKSPGMVPSFLRNQGQISEFNPDNYCQCTPEQAPHYGMKIAGDLCENCGKPI